MIFSVEATDSRSTRDLHEGLLQDSAKSRKEPAEGALVDKMPG